MSAGLCGLRTNHNITPTNIRPQSFTVRNVYHHMTVISGFSLPLKKMSLYGWSVHILCCGRPTNSSWPSRTIIFTHEDLKFPWCFPYCLCISLLVSIVHEWNYCMFSNRIFYNWFRKSPKNVHTCMCLIVLVGQEKLFLHVTWSFSSVRRRCFCM